MDRSEARPQKSAAFDSSTVKNLLACIPADLPYNEWFRVAAALKNSGADFALFDSWSRSAPSRYDRVAAESVWKSVGARGKTEITLGTLCFLAEQYNGSGKKSLQMLSAPESLEEQALQIAEFVELMFQLNEHFELVTDVRIDNRGRKTPDRSTSQITCREGSERYESSLQNLIELAEVCSAGAWISLNPIAPDFSSKAPTDTDVLDYRHVLIEADDIPREEQWQKLTELNLPIRAVTWSGGKSLHAVVKIDAGNDINLYRQRVTTLYAYLAEKGFPADSANKNPSRLTRLPGIRRDADLQYLIAREFGPESWNDFEKEYLPSNKTKKDRRTETSPLNGLQGGRPTMPVTEYAENFLSQNSENGDPRLRFANGRWWKYQDGIWAEFPDTDLSIDITSFLQKQFVQANGRISTSLISDVIANLKGLCGLTGVTMPCWLPDGTDASDIVCFRNGLLSIDGLINGDESGLQPCTPKYFGRTQVDYAYDPDAACPMWQEYLRTTFDSEEERAALQMMFGYILSNKIDKNVGFFLVGNGGDGKSTTGEILKALVGKNQTCCLPFANLGDRFSSFLLSENKLNLVEELPSAAEQRSNTEAEKTYKMVTDGAVIPVERKFHSPGQAPARAKCVFLTNSMPHFADSSNGLWDRVIIMPYVHRFRGTDEEKGGLKTILKAELSGIFNWAIEGARHLVSQIRFPVTSLSKKWLNNHRLTCNHEVAFLQETVVECPEGSCAKGGLYSNYRIWMEQHGYKPCGMNKFNDAVRAAFPDVQEKRERKPSDLIVWTGIKYQIEYI